MPRFPCVQGRTKLSREAAQKKVPASNGLICRPTHSRRPSASQAVVIVAATERLGLRDAPSQVCSGEPVEIRDHSPNG